MTWFFLSILTALFASARDFQSKRFLSRVDPLTVSWALSLFSMPVLGIALAFTGIPAVGLAFYLLVAGAGSVLTVGWILYIRALSVSEMSLSIPMISFSPLFLLVLASLEAPSWCAGSCALPARSSDERHFEAPCAGGCSAGTLSAKGPSRSAVTNGSVSINMGWSSVLSRA